MESKKIFESTLNTRDIGGYRTKTGVKIKSNQIIRSDVPIKLTSEELKYLRYNNIKTMIDLRSIDEITKRPSIFKDNKNFNYYQCNLYGDGGKPRTEDEISIIYYEITKEYKIISDIIRIIINSEDGVMYYCMAGKDRTGVLTALILAFLDIEIEDIYRDYQMSEKNLKKLIEVIHIENPKLSSFIGQSKRIYIQEFFRLFYKEHKSVDEYTNKIGLSEEEINRLKNKLLETIL